MDEAQAASLRLADHLEQRTSDLFALYQAGDITLERFRALVAADVARTNTAAVQLADIAVAAEAAIQRGEITGPLGIAPTPTQVDQERIGRDIDRILTEPVEAEDLAASQDRRLRRLARSEPVLTVAATVQVAMVGHGATGWVRALDRDPCPLCQGWADGVVRPPTARMARHLGCGCIQQPTF